MRLAFYGGVLVMIAAAAGVYAAANQLQRAPGQTLARCSATAYALGLQYNPLTLANRWIVESAAPHVARRATRERDEEPAPLPSRDGAIAGAPELLRIADAHELSLSGIQRTGHEEESTPPQAPFAPDTEVPPAAGTTVPQVMPYLVDEDTSPSRLPDVPRLRKRSR